MKMTSSTMLGIVLALTIFGAGVVTDRLTNVYITNLPLDEQGNLKIKAAEKPLQIYKDSVEITVLDWAKITIQSLNNGFRMDYGIMFLKDFPMKLAFDYSAKKQFQNVTNLWITILTPTYESATTLWKFNITFNDKVTVSSSEFKLYPSSHIKAVTLHIESLDVYQTVTPQINTLMLGSPMKKSYDVWEDAYFEIFKITLGIEYEYLA